MTQGIREIGGLFKKLIAGVLGKTISRWAEDMRIHQRFRMKHPLLASAVFQQKFEVVLHDLSYSGIAVKSSPDDEIPWNSFPATVNVNLRVLDQSINIEASRVYTSTGVSGFQFHHKTAETLIFLRDVLENMRLGSTLEIVESDDEEEAAKEGKISAISEDETITLDIKKIGTTSVELKFPYVDVCQQVCFDGKRVLIKSLANSKDFEVLETNVVNKPILRQAICILMGVQDDVLEKELIPFMGYALQHFDIKASSYRNKR